MPRSKTPQGRRNCTSVTMATDIFRKVFGAGRGVITLPVNAFATLQPCTFPCQPEQAGLLRSGVETFTTNMLLKTRSASRLTSSLLLS